MNREESEEYISQRIVDGHITDFFEMVDMIFDDIETRTCENCKYYNYFNESSGLCENKKLLELAVHKEFGCINFKRAKTNE